MTNLEPRPSGTLPGIARNRFGRPVLADGPFEFQAALLSLNPFKPL